ncbi:DinI-like family protein [Escherichia coli]|uniref:DinI-like family protein n=1 Tax=Escherichia TaxID=561 RepID=UPI000578FF0B|nr:MULTISPECIES: DinI-like family protein [Escherichia]EGJ0197912.1 DinI-like family protein [Escherichia coli]EGY9777100.1 DinI-like family protein [Escherichia coli]EHT7496308.1 DinI-like family protein [Escherichia coli]EHU9084132.1 DinI-like family protein [Escherichia coli]EIE2971699.1 DinI-like family protein [Escherichia coli]
MPLRIETLFDQGTVKSMKAGTLQALHHKMEYRLSGDWPEIWLRIDKSSQTSLSVSSSRNDQEKARVMEALEAIRQDDAWVPAA